MTETLTILVADDHTMVRAGLKQLLQNIKGVKIVGEAGTGLETIEKVRELTPKIVILDIYMPQMRGLEAIKDIKRASPDTKIIILSMFNKNQYVRESFKHGASAYLIKEAAAEELITAIESVKHDESYISSALSKSIIQDWLKNHRELRTSPELDNLTDREKSILKLLAEGHTNKKVAELLHISPKTVETHRYRIMEKLELDNFADLVKYAIREGIVEL
jgi:two-component system response regulator NreC